MHNLSKTKFAFLLLLIIGSVVIIVRHNSYKYIENEGTVFGTYYHITYSYSRDLQKEIEQRLNEVDYSLSPYNKRSIITAINENRSMKTDSMFRTVFRLAEEVSASTSGAFDITVAPLVNAWGFGFQKKDSVTPEMIRSMLSTVGYRKVSLSANGEVVKQNPAVQLDCSGIAKGYGCDEVAALFDSLGIKNYLIEIGGEIVARGKNKEKKDWTIGVNTPKEDSTQLCEQVAAVLSLTDCGMATSGNYRRFYYRNGRRYAHTIDPRTGYPVQHSLLSSTVIANTCARADAYATAFMVLGVDSAKAVLSRHPELEVYFIYTDSKGKYATWMSPALKRRIVSQ